MKKVCVITTISKTVESFAVDYYSYMTEEDQYDVTVVSDFDDSFYDRIPQNLKFHPIGMERGLSFSGFKTIIEMYRFFKKEKFDLVQYSTPNASLYASIAAFLAGIKVRLYCQWGLYYVTQRGIPRFFFKTMERLICALSTNVQPDSYGNLENSFNEGFYNESKGEVIWNGSASGIDLDRFDIDKKEEWRQKRRKELNLTEDNFLIGFVGRITRDKGIYELLDMLSEILPKYPNVHCMIAGDMEDEEIKDDPEYNWSFDHPQITYPGRISDIEEYYSAFDVFVLPSYREGFGTVIIEAEAMAVPVVVTNIPGPTEAMKPNETGLVVERENAEQLTEAIEKMITNPDMAQEMGAKGREYIETSFDSKILFDKILANRNRLIANSQKG